jgi:hypothetical protein
MRIVDRNELTDLDWFWVTIGAIQAKSWLDGRQNEDIEIEVGANVVEALRQQGAAKAGKVAYYLGVKFAIGHALKVAGKQVDEAVKDALVLKASEFPLINVRVSQEKRTVTKKNVTGHDAEGRILSWIEEQVEI